MKITETARFRKSFDSLNVVTKKKAAKQFRLFLANFTHPSLKTEKLVPKDKNIWSFRLDKSHRVIFTFMAPDTVLLLDIGPHDIYKKF